MSCNDKIEYFARYHDLHGGSCLLCCHPDDGFRSAWKCSVDQQSRVGLVTLMQFLEAAPAASGVAL